MAERLVVRNNIDFYIGCAISSYDTTRFSVYVQGFALGHFFKHETSLRHTEIRI